MACLACLDACVRAVRPVVKAISVAISTGLAILLIPVCQARLDNGGIGLVLAFGSTEILMLTAFLWLLPRGAVDRRGLLAALRAAAAGGGAGVVFVAPSAARRCVRVAVWVAELLGWVS